VSSVLHAASCERVVCDSGRVAVDGIGWIEVADVSVEACVGIVVRFSSRRGDGGGMRLHGFGSGGRRWESERECVDVSIKACQTRETKGKRSYLHYCWNPARVEGVGDDVARASRRECGRVA
jgi:hypothetical protein